jgi:transcriptional regulator with XRE-family HTH domain
VNNQTVATLMRVRGVTQTALAKHLGVTQGAVSGRLGGRIRWAADDIALLARLCGVSMETFFRPVTIDIRDATMIGEDIPGYHNQGLSPGVRVLKRVA